MTRKVLVPLDGSAEAEKVLDILREQGLSDAKALLFRVVPPAKSITVGGQVLATTQEEESERAEALSYLQRAMERHGGSALQWECKAVVHRSVPEAILECAHLEGVDIIAMYTHDRKGLARILRGSIARNVQRRAPIEVRVFKPRELARVA